MAQIEANHIHLNIGDYHILKDIDFKIEKGERIFILGHTGSGKSSLLSLLSGIKKPSTGDVLINGENAVDIPPKQRGISVLTQEGTPYDSFTGLQMLEGLGYNPLKDQELVHSFLVDDLLTSRLSNLSGGQRRRLELVATLLRKNQIVLLDEPFSSTDAPLKEQLLLPLKQYNQRTNSTLVVVTHDQREAFKLATKLVILKDGMIEQIGSPSDIYHQPDSLFVAGFGGLPIMNFIEKENYILGIRPTDWSLQSDDNFTVSIQEIDRVKLGNQVEVSYILQGCPSSNIQTATFPGSLPWPITELYVSPNKVLRFDKKTGKRI